jgi:acyl carrier protein
MGLDSVELVMEIEDEFGISVPDADAELIETAGQLHAYVCHRLRPVAPGVCPSARASFLLRRTLVAHGPVTRAAVRPSSRIAELIRPEFRHRWPAVATAIGVSDFFSFGRTTDVRFPAVFTTVRDLVRRMTMPRALGPHAADGGTEREVWECVRRIISEQMGVRLDEIHPHTHFINDLNMD